MSKKLIIFDIDETIFHTFAMINVLKNNKIIKKLNNQEFNIYNLKDGEKFDFSEFRNSEIFYNTSKPINNIFNLARRYIDKLSENDKLIFLTAREDFDDKQKFLETFRKYGLNIDHPNVYVERSGKLNNIKNVEKRKNIIIEKYLKTNKYCYIKMYDDSLKNLKEFYKLKSKYKKYNFSAIHVIGNGKMKNVENIFYC